MPVPSKITIENGDFQDTEGNLINGVLTLQLLQAAVVVGVGQISPKPITITVTAGQAAATPVWGVDNMSPNGLVYVARLNDTSGALVWGPVNWSIQGAGPLDLMNMQPTAANIYFPPISAGASALPDSVQNISTTQTLGFSGALNTLIKATSGSGGITLTLPTAVGISGQVMKIIKVDTGLGGVSIVGTSSQTINGSTTWSLSNEWQFIEAESDNVNWIATSYN